MFSFKSTKLEGLYIVYPDPYEDQRGKFYRVYCENEFKKLNHTKTIVNVNFSTNIKKGTIRGMHFQYPPHSEIKIVKCVKGSIFDVAIDLRRNSPTFLKWHGELLTDNNMKMLYIPEGFAHGFQTIESDTKVLYFVTEFYNPKSEGGIHYDDKEVNINWPLEITKISEKDKNLPFYGENFVPIDIEN
ncbi:MAG: dTDP-4-dehydrorhamnose 3,5-epimerase [Candidatus Lokiarchaeota archaeon]|nr:dTDP-4-dehydrorhamnose 3,5-epimerase [Candidatus Lokiarchaeota archaeon]